VGIVPSTLSSLSLYVSTEKLEKLRKTEEIDVSMCYGEMLRRTVEAIGVW